MSELLNKWLEHYDPIHRGWTPVGIANGVCTTSGFSFPRIRGGYNLYRASDGVPSSSSLPVGAAGADASEIVTFPWVTQEGTGQHTYRLVAVAGGGVSNWSDVVSTGVNLVEGQWTGLQPNSPSDLRVRAIAGGRFEVRWTYNETGQQTAPATFAIFHATADEPMDFDLPTDTISCVPGRFHYRYTSDAFEHDQWIRWAVRAVSSQGISDSNIGEAAVLAINQSPPSSARVMVTTVSW